jgi:hypothetical protein
MTATKTKEFPMLFSGPMIRALIENKKTQTRRILSRSNSTVDGSPWMKATWNELDFLTATVRTKRTIDALIYGSEDAAPEDIHLRVERKGEESFHRVRAKYEVGDRLWCRETFCLPDPNNRRIVCYRASGDPVTNGEKWKPSIFMPRWACRLELEITGVRVQRLQDISEEDAIAEGMDGRYAKFINEKMVRVSKGQCPRTPVEQYAALWDRINGKDPAKAWAANCFVWAISFRRLIT